MACEFTCISWEAAATLITGLAAVGAAGAVGWRQTEIMNEQAKIQRDQLLIEDAMRKLEGLKIKTDLFDRRMAVYQVANRWLFAWHLYGEVSTEQELQMLQAKDQAEFLFRREVWNAMIAWINQAQRISEAAEADPTLQPVLRGQYWKDEWSKARDLFAPELDLSDLS